MTKAKPKMLVATDNFLPRWDGIARFLSEILPGLMTEYDVTVVAPFFGPHKPDGYKLVTIPLGKLSLGDYVAARFDKKKIRSLVSDADIVFSQTIGPIGSTAIKMAKKKNKPCVSYIHNIEWELVPLATGENLVRAFLTFVVKSYARKHYNMCDLLIVPSESIGDKMSWHGINTQKRVVHLGINHDIFRPKEDFDKKEQKIFSDLRRSYAFSDADFVIGNHGRLAREKDLITLIRAYKWLKKKHPESRLMIVGDGLYELKQRIKSVPGAVWVSRSDQVHLELNMMDVYVTSSLTETTSLATLEAMSCGVPVVSTPVGYVKEYIQEGVTGFFFQFRDAYSLYRRISMLMIRPGLAESVGKKGRSVIINNFTWQKTTEGILGHLRSIGL